MQPDCVPLPSLSNLKGFQGAICRHSLSSPWTLTSMLFSCRDGCSGHRNEGIEAFAVQMCFLGQVGVYKLLTPANWSRTRAL